MVNRRHFMQTATAIGAGAGLAASAQSTNPAGPSPTALITDRLNDLGPESQFIARRVGLWDLTETVWATPGASAQVTTGLVAERTMMGALLQEFLRPPLDTGRQRVARTDLLTYNRLEGRWNYASFDMRAPVGLMPAWSTGRGDGATIDLVFAPFSVPGPGKEVTGLLLRMEQTIRYQDADNDVKDQYFTMADGTGTKWLAHQYAYRRRATAAV